MYIPTLNGTTQILAGLSTRSINMSFTHDPPRMNSMGDLVDYMRYAPRNALLKYADGAKTYLENTGNELPFFPKHEMDRIFANFTHHIKRASATEDLKSMGTYYSGTLKFGNPRKAIPVDFDTGSSDIWVPGAGRTAQEVYQPGESSSGSKLNRQFTLYYADGTSITCDSWQDEIEFNGLTAASQPFGVSLGHALVGNYGGIAGLGWPALSKTQAPSFVNQLFDQGHIDQNLFAFDLKRKTLEIGGYDSSAVVGDTMVWAPVSAKAWWVTREISLHKGNKALVSGVDTAVDSGTSAFLLPVMNAFAFWSAVPASFPSYMDGSIIWLYPCHEEFKDVHIMFASLKIPLTKEDMQMSDVGGGICAGAIYGSTTPENFVIAGDLFLSKVYTVYDYGASRIGAGIYK